MSKAKRVRANRRKRNPLPAYIDLIGWLKMRSRMSTETAMKICMSGVLKVDSHTIGIKTINGHKVLDRYVPSEYRGRIRVVTPK